MAVAFRVPFTGRPTDDFHSCLMKSLCSGVQCRGGPNRWRDRLQTSSRVKTLFLCRISSRPFPRSLASGIVSASAPHPPPNYPSAPPLRPTQGLCRRHLNLPSRGTSDISLEGILRRRRRLLVTPPPPSQPTSFPFCNAEPVILPFLRKILWASIRVWMKLKSKASSIGDDGVNIGMVLVVLWENLEGSL
ncbi:hypothetical protein NL676_016239 [Syzygium grande]|nr:hypothetical protein NL676_016239 [Syzygium grande]